MATFASSSSSSSPRSLGTATRSSRRSRSWSPAPTARAPASIYPTLTLLEDLGYVAVKPGEGARKLHEVTPSGRSFLDANRAAVDALFARMTEASQARGGGPAPQLIRAMENLKLALRLRQDRGPLTEDQLSHIAGAIDAAAIAIERQLSRILDRSTPWPNSTPK